MSGDTMSDTLEFRYHGDGETRIAELLGKGILIATTGDALNLIGNAAARRIILDAGQLAPEFWKLGSGLAGEILQKFTNYKLRVAIVGDFGRIQSPPLRDFIRESNATGDIVFVPSREEALARLGAR